MREIPVQSPRGIGGTATKAASVSIHPRHERTRGTRIVFTAAAKVREASLLLNESSTHHSFDVDRSERFRRDSFFFFQC